MAKRKKTSSEETFGQRLRRLRGVTQVGLAEAIGLAQSNISDHERDVYRPNSDMLTAIAAKLKVSADEILGFCAKTKERPVVSRRLMRRVIEIEKLSLGATRTPCCAPSTPSSRSRHSPRP